MYLLWGAAEGEPPYVCGHQVDVAAGHRDEVGVAVEQRLVGLLRQLQAAET